MVAEEQHLTRASRRLHLTQPALSAQIAKLEESVGDKLFDRSRRGMSLTEAGKVWLIYAERALGELDNGVREIEALQGLSRGVLRLGAGATATQYLLPPHVAAFRQNHAAVRFFLREAGSQTVIEEVLSGALDLGFITLPVPRRGDLKQLDVYPWMTDRLKLLVPDGHTLDGKGHFSWDALDGEAFVLFESGSAIRQRIEATVAAAEVQLDIVMELRSIEAIKQMVRAGIGSAFVSEAAIAPEEGLSPHGSPLERELAVITRAGRTPSPAARRFLELLGIEKS